MQRTAFGAGALVGISVKSFEHRWQIFDDVSQLELDAMDACVARETVPFEAVERAR